MNGDKIKVTTSSIKEMLDVVQADREARRVFLAMPREEQILALLGVTAYLSNEFANLSRHVVNLEKELMERANKRQKQEEHLVKILEETDPNIKALTKEEKQDTVQKIIALATRPAKVGNLLDKISSLIVIVIFILIIMDKLP